MTAPIMPPILEGRYVRLEPLAERHEAALRSLAADAEIGSHMASPPGDFGAWLANAYARAARGEQLPFAVIERASGAIVGSTRYMDIQLANYSVEVGGTWLGRAWWGTGLNREAKYLMLGHLFETVGCRRVWFKSDALNARSQRAIEGLGAVREGVLRKHMVVQGGRSRDSVVYSITDEEWPRVRASLEARLYGSVPRGDAAP